MVLSNKNREQKKENKKGTMRWLALLTVIILIPVAYLKGEVIDVALAFIIGAFGGFLIDYVGIMKLKLWKYPRQKFLNIEYFGIVVPSWGILGMTINLLWNWIYAPEILILLGITLALLILYEAPNLKSKSWEYYAPTWLIGTGWFPMILGFRTIFLIFSIVL